MVEALQKMDCTFYSEVIAKAEMSSRQMMNYDLRTQIDEHDYSIERDA